MLFQNGKFQWDRLENLIKLAREGSGSGTIDLTDTAQDAARLVVTDAKLRGQLLQAMTEDNRLHVDEALRVLELVRNDINPQRMIQASRWGRMARWQVHGEQGRARVSHRRCPAFFARRTSSRTSPRWADRCCSLGLTRSSPSPESVELTSPRRASSPRAESLWGCAKELDRESFEAAPWTWWPQGRSQ